MLHPAKDKSCTLSAFGTVQRGSRIALTSLDLLCAGSRVEVTCLARQIHDILPNVQQFALPSSSPITVRVRYVDRGEEVGHSRQCNERLCVAGQSLACEFSFSQCHICMCACVSMFVCGLQSVVVLARSSADFMTELHNVIAAIARVSVADVVSVHCGLVELTDRYDVDELVNGDTLIVRLRSSPSAPQSAGSAAASMSGHKRDAEGPAAKDVDGGVLESASKRPKI